MNSPATLSPRDDACTLTSTQAINEAMTRIQARLDEQREFLRDRLSRLYGHRPDFRDWFERLLAHVVDLAARRPDELRQLDEQRLAHPGWHLGPNMLAYTAYADKFANGLKGVEGQVPLLKELGVTYLHLLPFLKARSGESDGGFAVASFEEIEPRLGTMRDLEALAATLRHAGISLCSDFVLNHVADDHPWAVAARQGDPHYRGFFHVFADEADAARHELHLTQVFPQTAPGNFTHVDDMGGHVWTTFYPYQWDLNYANPHVFESIVLALLRLANRGIDAFRLDSTAYLWKREGTRCMNEPEVHWILQALRSIVQIAAPAVLLKAEAIVPTSELPPYFGEGDARGRECHLAYHSSLMSASWLALAEQRATVLRGVVRDTPALPEGGSWITYVRCHDDIGWGVLKPELRILGEPEYRLLYASQFFAGRIEGSYSAGAPFQAHVEAGVHGTNGMAAALVGLARAGTPEEETDAIRRLLMLYALTFTFGGIPLIYMGDEVGLGNADDEAVRSGVDGRELHRPRFSEAAWLRRHVSGTREHKVFAGLCELIALRRVTPALAADVPTSVLDVADAAILAIRRGEDFVGLSNFSQRSVTLDLSAHIGDATWVDLVDGTRVDMGAVQLPPWGFTWLSKGP